MSAPEREPIGLSCTACAVRPFSLCSALDNDELLELGLLSRYIHFGAGETVFAQEEMAGSFFNVLDGVMRLYKLLPDGRRQIVGFALPGDFLGMAASARHNLSADAIGPVVVCRFARVSFAHFIENRPHLLRRIHELAVRELSAAQDHMVLLGRRHADEKVASFLVGWSNRLLRIRCPSAMLPLPMSRQDVADYLGLTIETVSRTLTKFERDGLIEIVPGGVLVLDRQRAESLAAA
jgi:CRP/FNR family transcriptional regulator